MESYKFQLKKYINKMYLGNTLPPKHYDNNQYSYIELLIQMLVKSHSIVKHIFGFLLILAILLDKVKNSKIKKTPSTSWSARVNS